MTQPLVYVIVLNYNGREWLRNCLESVLATAYANFRVILVDNGSSDDSVNLMRTLFPQVEVILNSANLGFAEGNNVGIKQALKANAEYVVLLNPDTRVKPNWLAALVQVGESEPEIGILGAVQYNYDNDSFNTWTSVAAARYLNELSQQNSRQKYFSLEWVEGACFAVKREVFQQIGWLEPMYFSFYEEIDFCRRAACFGYQTVLVTDSRIHHYRGGVWQQPTAKNRLRDYYCDRGQFIYALTDPRRSFWGNLKWGGITLATKLKDSLAQWDWDGLANLVRIQLFLCANWLAVYRKWKREQLLVR